MNDDLSDVKNVPPRDIREGSLADVAMRNFYHAMGYADLDKVPDKVKEATKQAFQITLHGLDIPILCLDPSAKDIILLGIDGGKNDATASAKIIGKMKGLFPSSKILPYDSRYTQIRDVSIVHDRIAELLARKPAPTAEQILQAVIDLPADEKNR